MNLQTILSRSPESINKTRATRLTDAGARASQAYIDKLTDKRDSLVESIETLTDISARTDVNAGLKKLTNEEMRDIITQYHKKRAELLLLDAELQCALQVHEELITPELNSQEHEI